MVQSRRSSTVADHAGSGGAGESPRAVIHRWTRPPPLRRAPDGEEVVGGEEPAVADAGQEVGTFHVAHRQKKT
jgi:hypothetical protein